MQPRFVKTRISVTFWSIGTQNASETRFQMPKLDHANVPNMSFRVSLDCTNETEHKRKNFLYAVGFIILSPAPPKFYLRSSGRVTDLFVIMVDIYI